jgi:serine/threonine protein kinase, bacterial
MTIFCPNGHDNPDRNRFCQACGSEIVAPVGNSITQGVLLGDRYRITKEIGQGGFGRTYLCEDVNRFNEPCVLKEFAPQVQGTAFINKAQELFEREAGVMYRLKHPQIPMFREMFRVNRGGVGQLFLVQDYIAGDNYQRILRKKLQQGKTFTEIEITEFLIRILPVLSYIHSLGVIHRDISPDNLIKRNSDGLPVLIDFGGVKQVAVNATTQYMSGNLKNSEMPTRLGKVGYAPNEQLQRGAVFPHSDLYALAATTLVLLTGKEPPDLIDPQNFTWNWREYTSLSPHLAVILDRMLQLRPNDRFESAQDILTALKSENLGNLVIPPPPPRPKPVQAAPAIEGKLQVATVAPVANPQQSAVPAKTIAKTTSTTKSTSAASSLMKILGKTWISMAAVAGAIGVGWIVATLTARRAEPPRTPIGSSSHAADPHQQLNSNSTLRDRRQAAATTPRLDLTQIASIEPKMPTVLTNLGVNDRAFRAAVTQVFISQNPNSNVVNINDRQVRDRVDKIASELGDRSYRHLSNNAIKNIGKYSNEDRSRWRSKLTKLNLGERSLLDLTDAKYRLITDSSARKLGIEFDRFLNMPLGQIYLATMFDRFQAISSKQALDEIVFPVGGDSGTVSDTLQPGEGKAYIASLFANQNISVKIAADRSPTLSIYPPTPKLPPMLVGSQSKDWSGKTSINGYHEFVLVSNSDRPIQYKMKLTAADLEPSGF